MSDEVDDWNTIIDTDDDKGINLKVSYSEALHRFKVNVSYKDESLSDEFNANYEPRFGMDVSDNKRVTKIAEDMAQKTERKFGL